jgi:alpha-N-arabinofuranosidase
VQTDLGLVKGKDYVGRIVSAGEPAAGPVQIALIWGPGEDERQTVRVDTLTPDFATTQLRFTAGADTDDGRLEIVGLGKGTFKVGTASLMPADNVDGMRRDTLALLKELDAPIYRWPGGNFVSGYDWRDGIGDPDRRPPRKNPAWKGVEHNDFGIDEFMRFCREINTEPLVVVNSGAGDQEMALQELEYANGAADTPMGQVRAKNGHTDPYDVVWWGIGNEMYGGWQIGHMPLEDYVKKHNAFADAMRAKSPGIKLVAVGATGKWSETMLAQCADHMDALSEHFYNGEAKGLMTHVMQIPNSVRHKAENHRRYHETIPALKNKSIPIALDEWNYWYGDHVYGELGTRYYLKDALGIAAGIHEMARNSDVFYMANYAQTVNVIGCIKTTDTAAAFATTGLSLKLYRHHFGVIPVEVTGAPEPLDVAAALTEDLKTLTIGVVNPTREDLPLTLAFAGAKPSGAATLRLITGPDPMAYNEPGKEPKVRIERFPPAGPLKETIDVPAMSVMLLDVPVE